MGDLCMHEIDDDWGGGGGGGGGGVAESAILTLLAYNMKSRRL